MADAPDASVKLRTVLDYVPCEACLAQPVKDQEVLCSICHRLDRQVGVRVSVRRTVILERPSEPEPVVIEPPVPATPAAEDVEVVMARPGEALPEPRPGATQIVLEAIDEAPAAPAAPAPEPEPEPEWDDVVSWTPVDDPFEYVPGPRAAPPPPEPMEVPKDEYVFAPPARAAEPVVEEEPLPPEDWMPTEEVRVEPEGDTSGWARPADAPAPEAWAPPEPEPRSEPEPAPSRFERPQPLPEPEPEPAAAPVEEEVVETTMVEEPPAAEEAVVEMEIVEDDPEPAPPVAAAPPRSAEAPPAGEAPGSDLWRLRGFDRTSATALAAVGVTEVTHLAGHDPVELGTRAGLPPERLTPWIQVADLAHEAGVPLDAAVVLVAAGIAGPRGLREADADSIVERVQAFGNTSLAVQDVKRWKRRV